MLEAIKNKILAECQTDVCKQNFQNLIGGNLSRSSEFEKILGSPLLVPFLNKYSDNVWDEKKKNPGGLILFFSNLPIRHSLENFERMLCLIDLLEELKLFENWFNYLNSRVRVDAESTLKETFNTVLQKIQKEISDTNNVKLKVYEGVTLENLVDTYKKNNAIQPDLNVSPQSQNDPTNSANQTHTQKKIPPDVVEAYLKTLPNLKFTPTGNAPYEYRVTSNNRSFTCKIDINTGGISLKTDKVDRVALDKMIEILDAKITENNELREVVLSGDPDAIKIMKDKCLALNLKVVDPTQTKQKTPNNNGNQLITGAVDTSKTATPIITGARLGR